MFGGKEEVHIIPELGMECGWVSKYFPGAVSGEAAWRELN